MGHRAGYFHAGGGMEESGGIFLSCPGRGVCSAGTACRGFPEASSVQVPAQEGRGLTLEAVLLVLVK